MDLKFIPTYFPELTSDKLALLAKLPELYAFWNEQINVVSRKDLENLEERHILHSLGITKIVEFKKNTKVLDIGTGGGFPGIPLAICFPDCSFTLVDSIGKKIKVVQEIADALGLKNITTYHKRVEELEDEFHYIVSRAVAPTAKLLSWTKHLRLKEVKSKNGYYLLKGGDLKDELKIANKTNKVHLLGNYFEGEFFETKKVIEIKY
jgi:16S rRNA (guanine527-N7)-methyltransferase